MSRCGSGSRIQRCVEQCVCHGDRIAFQFEPAHWPLVQYVMDGMTSRLQQALDARSREAEECEGDERCQDEDQAELLDAGRHYWLLPGSSL